MWTGGDDSKESPQPFSPDKGRLPNLLRSCSMWRPNKMASVATSRQRGRGPRRLLWPTSPGGATTQVETNGQGVAGTGAQDAEVQRVPSAAAGLPQKRRANCELRQEHTEYSQAPTGNAPGLPPQAAPPSWRRDRGCTPEKQKTSPTPPKKSTKVKKGGGVRVNFKGEREKNSRTI